jgi:hypothetical protein
VKPPKGLCFLFGGAFLFQLLHFGRRALNLNKIQHIPVLTKKILKGDFGMKKLTFLLAIGYVLVFSAPLVWGQVTAHTPSGYNDILEGYGLKLADPQKCPLNFVAVSEGKNVFGTTAIAYTPAQYNDMLECYGKKLTDPQKCPLNFVTVSEGKYIFGTTAMAYSPEDYRGMLEAYGVKTSK